MTETLFKYIDGGGVIGYVILLLSVLALAYGIAAMLRTRTSQLVPPEQVSAIRTRAQSKEFEVALTECRSAEGDTFLGRIAAAGIDRSLRGPLGGLEARSAMEDAGEDETARLFRAIDSIAVIASVAPLLGLLGTVQGMIGAFETVAGAATKSSSYYETLAYNISIALITTFQGLVVAIPCVMLHSWLRSRIDRAASDAGRALEPLAMALEGEGAASMQPSHLDERASAR
ncbi:MAG: MotA/TolQ/ExbB proton channel family protein [Phycisphaerales bacterium]|nr:MotA/TolQ/ExbB proton channel family protein [Phycisphaerales bacterium]